MSAETAARGRSRPSNGWWRAAICARRRKEGFISVIAGFSFIGITLGVATLIIVMAVMNGFRQELFNKMLGLNGHVVVHSLTNFNDYDDVASRIRAVQGVKLGAAPGRGAGHGVDAVYVERRAGARLARGRPQAAQGGLQQYPLRHARRFRPGTGRCARQPARQRAQREGRRPGLAAHAARRLDRARHRATGQTLSGGGDLRDRHVRIRREHHLHAAQRGAALFQPARHRDRAGSRARLARRGGSCSRPRSSPPAARASM